MTPGVGGVGSGISIPVDERVTLNLMAIHKSKLPSQTTPMLYDIYSKSQGGVLVIGLEDDAVKEWAEFQADGWRNTPLLILVLRSTSAVEIVEELGLERLKVPWLVRIISPGLDEVLMGLRWLSWTITNWKGM